MYTIYIYMVWFTSYLCSLHTLAALSVDLGCIMIKNVWIVVTNKFRTFSLAGKVPLSLLFSLIVLNIVSICTEALHTSLGVWEAMDRVPYLGYG